MDGNGRPVDGSGSVLRAWLHGKTFDLRFFNLKLTTIPFSYFVIQFNIKTFGKKL